MESHKTLFYVGGALFLFPGLILGYSLLVLILEGVGIAILMYVSIKRSRSAPLWMKVQIWGSVILVPLLVFLLMLQVLPSRTRSNFMEKIIPSSWFSWKTVTKPKEYGFGFTFDIPATWPSLMPVALGYPITALVPGIATSSRTSGQTIATLQLFIASFSGPDPLVRDYPVPLMFSPLNLYGKTVLDYFNNEGLNLTGENCQQKLISNQIAYLCQFDSYTTDVLIITMPNDKALIIVDPVKIPITRRIIESVKITS